MEKAFLGPAVLAERMGALDVGAIAAVDPDEFKELFSRPPAVHRFPGSMAQRVQSVCQVLVDTYDGNAENLWADVDSGVELLRRISALPGCRASVADVVDDQSLDAVRASKKAAKAAARASA